MSLLVLPMASLALTDCDIEYAIMRYVCINYERGIHWNDESLKGIDYHLRKLPLLSSKDSGARMLHSMTEELGIGPTRRILINSLMM